MLPKLARLPATLPQRSRWTLLFCSLALFAMPTWFAAAQQPEPKKQELPEKTAGDDPAAKKPAAPPASTVADDLNARVARLAQQTAAADAIKQLTGTSQVEFYPHWSEQEQLILRELESNTSLDFTDESLDGLREMIMERHRINIIIDKNALEEVSATTDSADITLKVHEIPLHSALKLTLKTKGLAYVIEDSVLKITSRLAYQNEELTRTYPVRDLVGSEDADFLSLMEAIKQGVQPFTWKDTPHGLGGTTKAATPPDPTTSGSAGGGGGTGGTPTCTISMVPAAGSLVIRQTWEGHDEVLKLLRSLRKAKATTEATKK